MKNDQISLSKNRIKKFQKEIERRTIRSKNHNAKQILHNVNSFLYKGFQGYSWATGVLPIINVEKDIQTMNSFVMDAIEEASQGKAKSADLALSRKKATIPFFGEREEM